MTIDVSKIKVGDTIWVKAVVITSDPHDISRPVSAMVVDHPTDLKLNDFWPKIENIVGHESLKPVLRIGAIVKSKGSKYQGGVFAYKEVAIKDAKHGFLVLKIDDIEVLS